MDNKEGRGFLKSNRSLRRGISRYAKKGYRNVGLKDEIVRKVQIHIKKKDRDKLFPRSVPRFIMEAVERELQIEEGGMAE